jgi:hypothetical protein
VREWPFTEGPSEEENEQKGAESALFSSENAERSAERERSWSGKVKNRPRNEKKSQITMKCSANNDDMPSFHCAKVLSYKANRLWFVL